MVANVIVKTGDLALHKEAYLGNLLRQCEDKQPVFNKGIAGWLQELRQQSAYQVVKHQLPTTRDEEWRFTDLSELAKINLHLATQPKVTASTVAGFVLSEVGQQRLIFVNGYYSPELSDVSGIPEGVYVGNLGGLSVEQSEDLVHYLGQQADNDEVFTALNTSGITDIAVIWARKNVILDKPIHLLFISVVDEQPSLIQPRTLVIAETGASLQLIENYVAYADGCSDTPHNHPYLTNAVTEIYVGDNAEVKHTRLQRESGDAFHIGKSAIAQQRNSRYNCTEVNLGAKLSRHNLQISQEGEQTETELKGLTMIGDKQVSDTHSIVSLNHPHGTVNQLHKCIVDNNAQTVFSGKIFVPKPAQLTNAAQLNRNLMLSPKARVNTKPELQITADNVKCSHGATVSQLEDEEIFYLRSRGLNEYDARHLLIDAFAGEILDEIKVVSLQHRLTQCVACRTLE